MTYKSTQITTNNLILSYNYIKVSYVKKIDFSLKKLLFLFLVLTSVLVNFGCWAYSFTGASVPEHLKSIAIPIADDRSGSGEPGVRETLTDKLIQKFIDDNTLQVTEKNKADALLVCIITSLSDAPSVVSAGEQVQTRRITISVQVIYKDLVKRKTIYQNTFSNYGDYPSSGNIAERNAAVQDAIENISEDILLETVSGW